ncbi:GPP34 family phosphoprotein [Umezawaea sp. Da 62-37]|uniref:GPP34 family phosphoprotein n=1 Tax=Umezawaea sp. Da 62-37 TaxID=3075927 RepID=UPI0028F6E38D|nr:GPP34 family phosphoprotein [Umezawaea sp. Da 62-37]WNV83077.1 GPP34 family phosphoprotein [Umezawaea sp. Da 62-37]
MTMSMSVGKGAAPVASPVGNTVFLATIHDESGRPRLENHARAKLLGTAVLGELMARRAIVGIRDGRILLPSVAPPIGDPEVRFLERYLRDDTVPDEHHQPGEATATTTDLRAWLTVLSTDSAVNGTRLVGARMRRTNLVVPVRTRLFGRTELRPVELNDVLTPYLRLQALLAADSPLPGPDRLVLGLLHAAGLTAALGCPEPDLAARYADLPPAMRVLIDTTRAVLAEGPLTTVP